MRKHMVSERGGGADQKKKKKQTNKQISPVLNLNACFQLFLCCLFLYFDFSFGLRK